MHIEKLEGITKEDNIAEDVLVIWVAKRNEASKSTIVGWYKNATVFRYYEWRKSGLQFNIVANVEDCVLLPLNKRHKIVPRAGKDGYSYGMGQANVWFAQSNNDKEKKYVEKMEKESFDICDVKLFFVELNLELNSVNSSPLIAVLTFLNCLLYLCRARI